METRRTKTALVGAELPKEALSKPSSVARARGQRRAALIALGLLVVAFGAVRLGLSRPVDQARIERVYLVPIHAAPELMESLKHSYRGELGLDIEILPAIQADSVSHDDTRQQLIAEELGAILRDRFGALTESGRAVVIAVTSWDIYSRSRPWRFAFGYRSQRYAVVSYARMHFTEPNGLGDDRLLFRRLRKMVTRYIGFMALGIGPSPDRRSLMYQDIMGLDDLDRIEEDPARAGFPTH